MHGKALNLLSVPRVNALLFAIGAVNNNLGANRIQDPSICEQYKGSEEAIQVNAIHPRDIGGGDNLLFVFGFCQFLGKVAEPCQFSIDLHLFTLIQKCQPLILLHILLLVIHLSAFHLSLALQVASHPQKAACVFGLQAEPGERVDVDPLVRVDVSHEPFSQSQLISPGVSPAQDTVGEV